jgi:uncharacterized membrane-anchored protein YhcB (DUF1043 family)
MRYTYHERVSLGLRHCMNDIICAQKHLEIVKHQLDGMAEELEEEIETMERQLAELLPQIEHCQQQVYQHWHESLPPLNLEPPIERMSL